MVIKKRSTTAKKNTAKKSSPKRASTQKASTSTAGKRKVKKVMHEYKHGELHSGSKSGPAVKSRKQAVAIALSEARKSGARVAKKK